MTLSEIVFYPVKRVLFAGWFVWSLTFAYVIAFICFKVLEDFGYCKLMIVLGVVCILLYFLPGLPRGACQLHYLPLMFPFFIAGIAWRKVCCQFEQFARNIELWKNIGMVCFVLYLTVVSAVPAAKFGLSMYSGQVYGVEWITSPIALGCTVLRIAVGLLGAFGLFTLIDLLSRFASADWIATFGTTTLGVYLLHQWLLDRLFNFGILPGGLVRCLGVSVVLFLFCHAAVSYSNKFKCVNVWLWGRDSK